MNKRKKTIYRAVLILILCLTLQVTAFAASGDVGRSGTKHLDHSRGAD